MWIEGHPQKKKLLNTYTQVNDHNTAILQNISYTVKLIMLKNILKNLEDKWFCSKAHRT